MKARALLAAGVTAVIVVAAVGWMLVRALTGTHGIVDAQSPAAVAPRAHASATVHAPPTLRELKPVSAESFDPYGNGNGENNQLASFAIDGSSATAWHSDWYDSARFGNWKPGTGLLLDMGRKVRIASVLLTLGSNPGADLQLRVGDAPASLADMTIVARATDVGGQVRLRLANPAYGRYVLIWFTKLPPATSGTFQVSVYNVRLEGWR